jgi:hypothetical protein
MKYSVQMEGDMLNWGWNHLEANRILEHSNSVMKWYVVQNGGSVCWDYQM